MSRFLTIRTDRLQCELDLTEVVLVSWVLSGRGAAERSVFLLRNGSEVEFDEDENALLLDEAGKKVSLQEAVALWQASRRTSLASASLADVADMLSESLGDIDDK